MIKDLWRFIQKRHTDFEKTRIKYLEMIAIADNLANNNETYNKRLNGSAKRKIAFHDHLNQALKSKKIDLAFEDEYRYYITEFLWNNVRQKEEDYIIHWDDVPGALNTVITQIQRYSTFQKVRFPLKEVFVWNCWEEFSPAKSDRLDREQIINAYNAMTQLEHFRDIKNKFQKIRWHSLSQVDRKTQDHRQDCAD